MNEELKQLPSLSENIFCGFVIAGIFIVLIIMLIASRNHLKRL